MKVLWCHSHLVVLEVSVPTHVLAFVRKTFNCDFIFTYHGSPRPWPIPLNVLPEYKTTSFVFHPLSDKNMQL